MSYFIDLFIKFSPQIFAISGATLLLGGLVWLLRRFPTIGLGIRAFLHWLGRLITNLFFFLAKIPGVVWDTVQNWRASNRTWALAHQFAEEIRHGKLSSSMLLYATAAVRCDNCHGSRSKPRWTVANASAALDKDLEDQISRGLCHNCLSYLAVAARVRNGAAATPAVSAAPTAAPSPAPVPVSRGERKGPSFWAIVIMIIAGGYLFPAAINILKDALTAETVWGAVGNLVAGVLFFFLGVWVVKELWKK